MKVVVSDTSPIRALVHLRLQQLLRDLFTEVFIPPAVAAELGRPRAHFDGIALSAIPEVKVRAPLDTGRVAGFLDRLDLGEAEAVALAIEIGASTVLMDEAEGRRVAEDLGLRPLGVLGILVQAKGLGLIARVGPLIDRLQSELRFYVSEPLRAEVLRRALE